MSLLSADGILFATMTPVMRSTLACLFLLSVSEVNSLLGFPSATFSRLTNPHMVATLVPPSVIIHPTQNSVPIIETRNIAREKLPWSQSINPERDLSYMPMFQLQLDLMRKMGFEEVELSESLVHRESSVKPARIGNACFKNDKFRKIRLTYFDAGDNVQVQKQTTEDIKKKIKIRCYQGIRHKNNLPVRGQRTHTNAQTQKHK